MTGELERISYLSFSFEEKDENPKDPVENRRCRNLFIGLMNICVKKRGRFCQPAPPREWMAGVKRETLFEVPPVRGEFVSLRKID
jgi:hypothetical protein